MARNKKAEEVGVIAGKILLEQFLNRTLGDREIIEETLLDYFESGDSFGVGELNRKNLKIMTTAAKRYLNGLYPD